MSSVQELKKSLEQLDLTTLKPTTSNSNPSQMSIDDTFTTVHKRKMEEREQESDFGLVYDFVGWD